MIESPNRRMMLRAIGAVGAALIGGCGEACTRSLDFSDVAVRSDDGEEVTVEVTPQPVASSGGCKGFTDVRLVGYDDSGALVCEHHLGELSTFGERAPVRMSCDAFPTVITYVAEQTPCDAGVEIEVLFYLGKTDSGHTWDGTHNRQCDEALPPSRPERVAQS